MAKTLSPYILGELQRLKICAPPARFSQVCGRRCDGHLKDRRRICACDHEAYRGIRGLPKNDRR
jgi:hypothetical protein